MTTRAEETVPDATAWNASKQLASAAVEAALEDYFGHSAGRAAAAGPGYARLWQELRAGAAGGKRLRPALAMAAYQGLGGSDLAAAGQVAAAYELLHTALIVHDDVIDQDFRRRGVPNLAGVYRDRAERLGFVPAAAAHRGQSMAIIAGDLALSASFRLIATAPVPAAQRFRLLEVLDQAVFASAAGEMQDVEFSAVAATPGLEEVLQMSRLKTAVYSFQAPLQSGAVLAGADEATVEQLGDIGRLMGTAYQLVDDLLGTFGDEAQTGKTAAGDVAEGKFTVLMAYASCTPQWQQISAAMQAAGPAEGKVARVRDLLESSGARARVEELAASYADRVRDLLAGSRLPAGLRADLAGLLELAVLRLR